MSVIYICGIVAFPNDRFLYLYLHILVVTLYYLPEHTISLKINLRVVRVHHISGKTLSSIEIPVAGLGDCVIVK